LKGWKYPDYQEDNTKPFDNEFLAKTVAQKPMEESE
jgi:hypothetical protein